MDSIVIEGDDNMIGMISSTEVRKRVRQSFQDAVDPDKKFLIDGLVTKGIVEFIRENKLYL